MPKTSSRRPKVVLFPNKRLVPAQAGASQDDYAIYASYRPHVGGVFVGTLKVVRQTDGRLLYPYDGAEQLGPCPSKDEATKLAVQRGDEIVRADLECPEL
ncbi:DUF6723 family protein [Caballeronia fortuita]